MFPVSVFRGHHRGGAEWHRGTDRLQAPRRLPLFLPHPQRSEAGDPRVSVSLRTQTVATPPSTCLTFLSACLSVLRLMGSMSLSNHYRSEVLLDVETAAGGFQQRKGMRRCLPLTFCFHTGLSQYMALEPAEGRQMFESFYPCPVSTFTVCLFFQSKCSVAFSKHIWNCFFFLCFRIRRLRILQPSTCSSQVSASLYLQLC